MKLFCHVIYAGLASSLLVVAPTARSADVKMDEEVKKATARGLEWLAAKQNADGSWSESRYPHNTAITAFSLLAFMSQGHLPNQGQFSPEVAKGMRFLISAARSDGYLIGSRGGNMYCHAMATLALAELWGMGADAEIKPVLTKAVDLIVKCQNYEGGWRYDPQPTDADISVTIMCVMALRASKNGGLHVPNDTLKRAIAYINSCYDSYTGGYRYQARANGQAGFARTAAGMCVLQLAGEYDAKQIPQAVEYLKDNFNARQHFWYGHYYAAHAMHQIGGKEWELWYRHLRDTMLSLQSSDGGWSYGLSGSDPGPVYATAIAVIALSVPANYLPIFQR